MPWQPVQAIWPAQAQVQVGDATAVDVAVAVAVEAVAWAIAIAIVVAAKLSRRRRLHLNFLLLQFLLLSEKLHKVGHSNNNDGCVDGCEKFYAATTAAATPTPTHKDTPQSPCLTCTSLAPSPLGLLGPNQTWPTNAVPGCARIQRLRHLLAVKTAPFVSNLAWRHGSLHAALGSNGSASGKLLQSRNKVKSSARTSAFYSLIEIKSQIGRAAAAGAGAGAGSFGLLTVSFITINRLWPQIMHLTPS